MQLIDSITLSDCLKAPFTYSKDSIDHIEFSMNSEYLATAVINCFEKVFLKNIF